MARVSADQRRQDFVEAAVRVISEHGVSGATTRRIADAADAPLATLHYCFHTKEQLFLAVFQHQADQLVERLAQTPESNGLGAAATHVMRDTLDWFAKHEDYARAQYDLILWAMRQEGQHSATAVYDMFFSRFAQVLRASLEPTDDPDLVEPLARLVIALLDGLVLNWVTNPDHSRTQADLDLSIESIELLIEARSRAQTARARKSKAS
jgi:AcrR family transcriptional regulator